MNFDLFVILLLGLVCLSCILAPLGIGMITKMNTIHRCWTCHKQFKRIEKTRKMADKVRKACAKVAKNTGTIKVKKRKSK